MTDYGNKENAISIVKPFIRKFWYLISNEIYSEFINLLVQRLQIAPISMMVNLVKPLFETEQRCHILVCEEQLSWMDCVLRATARPALRTQLSSGKSRTWDVGTTAMLVQQVSFSVKLWDLHFWLHHTILPFYHVQREADCVSCQLPLRQRSGPTHPSFLFSICL